MDFKQIEAFVNVIRYKGFSKAAEAIFITQPTISAHINALERELQMQLIDRTKKEAVPTAEGRLFYNYALTMLNTREQAIYSLQNYALNINGTVDIKCSSIPGEYIVPPLIAGFKREYDKVSFNIEQSDSASVINHIREHKGDIGFTGRKMNDGLTYHLLVKDKAVLIAPDNEKFEKMSGSAVLLDDILNEPLILREKGSATRETFENTLKEKGLPCTSMNIAARMNSMEAIKQAVRGGMGVSIISELAAEKSKNDRGYRIFDIANYDSERKFYMVYDSRFTMTPTAETFKCYVLEQYGYDQEY